MGRIDDFRIAEIPGMRLQFFPVIAEIVVCYRPRTAGVLPLRLGGQTAADPIGIGLGTIPGDINNRIILITGHGNPLEV